jgi:pentatricopeptide repeat protein
MSERQIGFVGAMLAALLVCPAAGVAEPRSVIELFTSQGCSSCPVADDLLGELSQDPTVVALSLPIDYWDYLGWKDTLADARHTARQKGYSKVRGDRTVYTPQMVVNGVAQALGNDKTAIEQAMAQSSRGNGVLSVPIEVEIGHDTVTVTAAAGEARPAQVWLCPLSKEVKVQIGRGENRGRTVTYTNVVRGWIRLGEWTGARATYKLMRRELQSTDADAFAVLIQSGTPERPGVMLGAALAGLQ